MIYRITRSKLGGKPQDRQGYYIEGEHEQEAIARFFKKYPQYLGEKLDIEYWGE